MKNFRPRASFAVLVLFLNFRTISGQGWIEQINSCRTPDREVGNCISAKKCKPIIDFLSSMTRPFSAYLVDGLRAYQCGFEDKVAYVCCPSKPISIVDPTATQPSSTTGPPDVSNHKNLNLLPGDCGHLNSVMKINNRNNAALNEFPWMALLSYRTKRGPQFRCGGTIINERYILTAAHCLQNLTDPLLGVRVGEYNISSKIDCGMDVNSIHVCSDPVQDLPVEEIIIHEKFSTNSRINDIGLVRVPKMNLQRENARPVCLPVGESRTHSFEYATVTGWGVTTRTDKRRSNILQLVNLRIVSSDECQMEYESQKYIRLADSQLCASGEDQKNSCSGDSGGPLQVADYVNGHNKYVQQGIVSLGFDCGLDRVPGVYTKVAYHMEWILNKMKV